MTPPGRFRGRCLGDAIPARASGRRRARRDPGAAACYR